MQLSIGEIRVYLVTQHLLPVNPNINRQRLNGVKHLVLQNVYLEIT